MEFRKEIEVAKVLVGDKIIESRIEIRFDPLTLQTSRIINKSLNMNFGEFDEEIANSKSWCPFCSEKIEVMAARDPEIMKAKLWRRGEAILFANLMPYAKYSLIARLTEEHYLKLSEFRAQHFFDAFKLAQDYVSDLPEGKFYITIGMNYLKSAGSSIMHPHLQIVISENSTDYVARLEWSALEYKEQKGKDFWRDLVDFEKEGERYVGRTEKTEWIAAFAPKGFYHFIGIPEEWEFVKMSEKQLYGIATGLIKILRFYEKKGMNSFNFILFCADRIGEHFRTNLNIVARSPFGKYYWCDVFFPKMFQDESITFFTPEEYAKELKEIWNEL